MDQKNTNQTVVIEAKGNGPLIVKGLKILLDSSGDEIPITTPVIALCRCGASENKPFCDGTHSKIGFSGKRITDKPVDKEREYAGKNITAA